MDATLTIDAYPIKKTNKKSTIRKNPFLSVANIFIDVETTEE